MSTSTLLSPRRTTRAAIITLQRRSACSTTTTGISFNSSSSSLLHHNRLLSAPSMRVSCRRRQAERAWIALAMLVQVVIISTRYETQNNRTVRCHPLLANEVRNWKSRRVKLDISLNRRRLRRFRIRMKSMYILRISPSSFNLHPRPSNRSKSAVAYPITRHTTTITPCPASTLRVVQPRTSQTCTRTPCILRR